LRWAVDATATGTLQAALLQNADTLAASAATVLQARQLWHGVAQQIDHAQATKEPADSQQLRRLSSQHVQYEAVVVQGRERRESLRGVQ